MASMDIGIDLGTSNMLAGNTQEGILVREPTLVAVTTKGRKLLGVGSKVYSMLGREHGKIQIIHPMENGVISDFLLTEALAKHLFKQVGKSFFFKPRVIACVPAQLTDLEAQSMIEVLTGAGARQVQLMQEPVAAAIGAGVDFSKPLGILIVDMGGGTTDVASMSLGGIVASSSTLFAGNAIDNAIERHVRQAHNLIVGQHTILSIKVEIASFWKKNPEKQMEIKGRGIVTGLPTKTTIKRSSLYPILQEVGDEIVAAIQRTLENTPPEISGDIISRGLILTGGGALMNGLAEMLGSRIGVPVVVPENPMDCALLGTIKSFSYWGENFDGFYNPVSPYGTIY